MGQRAKPPGHRVYLLEAAIRFVDAARQLRGVQRISLLGSITTERPNPKDVDVLVVITEDTDITALANHARRLQGAAQQVNLGADVFLADDRGNYLGRTCPWKNCQPGVRVACDALHCGQRPHLHDDLDAVRLSADTVQSPPITLWPGLVRRCVVPEDVETILGQFKTPSNNALEPTARESTS
jgi:predicted nucleotidyltransferase